MSKNKSYIPKGMRDFTPEVMFRRNYIFETIKTSFERYGYAPISTPAMENITTLAGKYGDEGDRLIFKVLNSGDYLSKVDYDIDTDSKSLSNQISNKALRYDLTVPFARFVVQNKNNLIFPFKRYQMQNVWRADKPQRGRYREFYQCDADFIGTDSLFCEIELIQLYDEVFTQLCIPNVDICINNRKILSGMVEVMGEDDLFDDIVITLDKLNTIGLDRVKEELICKGISSRALSILSDFINVNKICDLQPLLEQSETGKKGLSELQFIIDNINKLGLKSANLTFDITLARGLNYYTGCILEVKATDIKIGSIGGGGRYDNLTSNFGLQGTSGVGISFGIDRIYLVMEDLNIFPDEIGKNTKVMFANFGDDEAVFCLPLLSKLRDSGISSELYPKSVKLKKQMSYANSKGIDYVIIVGENEMQSGILSVKNMKSGEQNKLSIKDLIKNILHEHL